MSTDDSISEDVSSSGALSHCHVSPDGDGGKESETSLVSSEGTSASGLAVSEDRHTASKTTGGTVETRPMDITPTLRALVQEIQSSGETDPEIWKDCEVGNDQRRVIVERENVQQKNPFLIIQLFFFIFY
uniref:Uncharacterized protein n=1 Tax=Echeneis naucrates TaxID=173247 RepID=A0A665U1M1_ECHNA